MPADRSWRSFRLRDLFALVTIAAIAFAIGAPYVASSWYRQRQERCADNLRLFGVHFHEFADRDPWTRYSTGAPDFLYDGCPDTWGWVADVVNVSPKLCPALFCPDSSAIGTETYNDLVSASVAQAKGGAVTERLSAGKCGCGPLEFGGTRSGTSQRSELVRREFWDRGFNTNYVASWHFARSGFVHNSDVIGEPILKTHPDGPKSLQGNSQQGGPALTRNTAESGLLPAANITLLGCGNPSTLPSPLVRQIAGGSTRGGLVPSMSGGPYQWDVATNSFVPPVNGASTKDQYIDDISEISHAPLGGTGYYLQDTRAWKAWHRSGTTRACNLLMADGSVKGIRDVNGDGFLNPGFSIPDNLSREEYARLGYRDSTQELLADEVFCGVYLRRHVKCMLYRD